MAVKRIAGTALMRQKAPAFIEHFRVNNRDTDVRIKGFKLSHYQGAMCPRAGQRDIQMITTAFCLKLTTFTNSISE